jgi:hypothetical protein
MAAPDYVPAPVDDTARVYHSPPWRPEPWVADRPAEIVGRQPLGDRLGSPGPDQGYALHLGRRMRGKLSLTVDESEDDALAGCIAVAMRRSALFGRAPVIHDLTVALTLWGFLGDAPADLVAARTRAFAAVAHTHHYMERRAIVDNVPEDVLRLSPAQIAALVHDEPERVLEIAAATLAAQHHDAAV